MRGKASSNYGQELFTSRFMIVPSYPSRIVPLEIFMARKFGMGFFEG